MCEYMCADLGTNLEAERMLDTHTVFPLKWFVVISVFSHFLKY